MIRKETTFCWFSTSSTLDWAKLLIGDFAQESNCSTRSAVTILVPWVCILLLMSVMFRLRYEWIILAVLISIFVFPCAYAACICNESPLDQQNNIDASGQINNAYVSIFFLRLQFLLSQIEITYVGCTIYFIGKCNRELISLFLKGIGNSGHWSFLFSITKNNTNSP